MGGLERGPGESGGQSDLLDRAWLTKIAQWSKIKVELSDWARNESLKCVATVTSILLELRTTQFLLISWNRVALASITVWKMSKAWCLIIGNNKAKSPQTLEKWRKHVRSRIDSIEVSEVSFPARPRNKSISLFLILELWILNSTLRSHEF